MGDWDRSAGAGKVASGLGSTTAARRHTCLIRGPPDSLFIDAVSLDFSAVVSPGSFLLGSEIGESDETILGGEARTNNFYSNGGFTDRRSLQLSKSCISLQHFEITNG